jgi:hypothetical protein
MSIKRDSSGRLEIDSPLMGESLMDKSLLASTDSGSIHRLMPDLTVVKIGGQSIIDRGSVALLPILDELVEARQTHKILITTGGGTRARHAYAIATDLGMPTGVLAKLGSSISEQNALMIAILLSQRRPFKTTQLHDARHSTRHARYAPLWVVRTSAHVRSYPPASYRRRSFLTGRSDGRGTLRVDQG